MDLLEKLRDTFASGKTRELAWRQSQLQALQRLLLENENRIYAALQQDLGKCQFESRVSEFDYVLKDIRLFQKKLARWSRPRRIGTPILAQPGYSRIVPEPLGTVLIMGAWNYPLQLVLSPMVAAIGAGNCVLLKPSELAMATSNLIADLLPKYLDTHAIAVVEGGVEETTELLKQRFDHILYTGSEAVGKIVMRAASEHLTPVTLELGGKSPCIVDDETNLKVTADRLIWAKFINAGQTCIAPDYVLVTPELRPKLQAALKASLARQYGDDPAKSRDYGRIVNDRHFRRVLSYLDDQGAALIHGGESDAEQRYIAPTLLLNPSLESSVMREEIFGPILPIIEMTSIDSMLRFIKSREKPLALYLFSSNADVIDRVTADTSSGSVCINDAVIFMINAEMPFGGVGNSGMGCYHGKWGFETFSHLKPIMYRRFAADAPLRYAPYTKLKQWLYNLVSKL